MGIAIKGEVLVGGENVAIQGLQPSGMAAKGNTIWQSIQWKLIASTKVAGNSANMGYTTPPINTTGAVLLVAVTSYYSAVPPPGGTNGISDNQGNTWILATGIAPSGSNIANFIYFCLNPYTSASHTATTSGQFTSLIFMAFESNSAAFLDQTSLYAPTTSSTALQAPPITPSSNSSLIVTGVGNGLAMTGISIDSGFTITGSVDGVSSATIGGAGAYLSQGSAAQVSPTWSGPSGLNTVTMASFAPTSMQLLNKFFYGTPAAVYATPAFDSTGATLLVAVAVVYTTTTTPTPISPNDSQGNLWILANQAVVNPYQSAAFMWYCINPITSPTHVINMWAGSTWGVLAYRTTVIPAYDKSTIAWVQGIAPNYTLQIPALTPSGPNSLIVAVAGGGATISNVDSDFVMRGSAASVPGQGYAGAMADLELGRVKTVSPTFTFATNANNSYCGIMASFLPVTRILEESVLPGSKAKK